MKIECESEDDSIYNIESLNDLVKLANSFKRKPTNTDLEKLWKIKKSIIKLNNLVGLESLKKDIMNQILFIIQNLSNGEMMHTALMGPPGVGKTTVAQIIGEIYNSLGNLTKGTFKVVGREELIGEYLGQTAVKTRKVLNSSIGGVLFIDEAYSLGSSSKDNKDTYSKECIDTLTKFLSEHTKNFVCIIAGYSEHLQKCFFDNNPGLNRRFPWKYELDEYKPENLCQIFNYQLKQDKWRFKDAKCNQILKQTIEINKDLFKNNGGDTMNLITSCKIMHSKRMFGKPKTWKRYLNASDIKKGMNMFKTHKLKEKLNDTKPPQSMYT
jgi:replication-associated recombination protein RarA